MTTIPDIKTAIYRYLNLSSEITKDRFTDKFQEPLEAGNRDSLVHTSWISDIFHWRDSIMKGQRFSSIIFSNINELESIERKLGSVKKLPLIMRYYIADCLLNIYSSTSRFYRDLRDLRRKVRNKTTMKSIVYLNNNPYLITKSFTDVYGNNHVYVKQYAGAQGSAPSSKGGFFSGIKNFFKRSKPASVNTQGKGFVGPKTQNAWNNVKKNASVSTPVSKPMNTNTPKVPEPPKNKWSTAKKIAVGGAIGTAALGAAATYGTYKLAKGTVKTAGKIGSSAINAVKQAIPSSPSPVGNAAQANPAAQPQAVIHHHHYGS